MRAGVLVAAVLVAALFGPAQPAQAGDAMAELKAKYARPATFPHPADNPLTEEKRALGATLFFDPRLSGDNNMSCATCHNPSLSWGDGKARWMGPKGVLPRRTPTILNLVEAELLMWDGRHATLEEQAMGPLLAEAEMNQDPADVAKELAGIAGYPAMFDKAFPGKGITPETIGMALAAFQRTVISGEAPFDRWVKGDEGAISEAAKRGFALFNGKGNCAVCHSGWNLTDHSFHDIGLPDADIGRAAHLPLPSMQHAFKTPTLRDVDRRGPYMHDGSIPTLRGVMVHYNEGGVDRPSRSAEVRPLGLTDAEIDDLVAFMLTLTGEQTPFALPILPVGQVAQGS